MKTRNLAAGIFTLAFIIGCNTDFRGKPDVIQKYSCQNYEVSLTNYSKCPEDTEVKLLDVTNGNEVIGIDENTDGSIDGLTLRIRKVGEQGIQFEEVQRVYDSVKGGKEK